MNKRIYSIIAISIINVLLVACGKNSSKDLSIPIEFNNSIYQESEESSQSKGVISDNQVTSAASENSDTLDEQTEDSSSATSSSYVFTDQTSNVIIDIHLQHRGDIFPSWNAVINDESDLKHLSELLKNMEPADYYDPLIGGYTVLITIDEGGKVSEYCVTITSKDKAGTVLAYNTAIFEDPANIKNYDPESKYYKWFNIKSDIWDIIQKYGNCPFEYKDGKFIEMDS